MAYYSVSYSQVSSIDTVLTFGARGCKFESCQNQYSCESWVLEIPLDKGLAANCLLETHTKLKELIRLQ